MWWWLGTTGATGGSGGANCTGEPPASGAAGDDSGGMVNGRGAFCGEAPLHCLRRRPSLGRAGWKHPPESTRKAGGNTGREERAIGAESAIAARYIKFCCSLCWCLRSRALSCALWAADGRQECGEGAQRSLVQLPKVLILQNREY